MKRRRLFLLTLISVTLVLVCANSWLFLYGQQDPDIKIGMTYDEAKSIAGEPNRTYGMAFFGFLVYEEVGWQRGLRLTKIRYEFQNEKGYRVTRVDNESVSLLTFLRENYELVKDKLQL